MKANEVYVLNVLSACLDPSELFKGNELYCPMDTLGSLRRLRKLHPLHHATGTT